MNHELVKFWFDKEDLLWNSKWIFSLYSPNIRVEVVRRGKVRRAKLYYLRSRTGKSARIAELRNTSSEAKK